MRISGKLKNLDMFQLKKVKVLDGYFGNKE